MSSSEESVNELIIGQGLSCHPDNSDEDIPEIDLHTSAPVFLPYHPGLPSIQMAQDNYNNFCSDHVPIMVEVPHFGSRLRVISWNVMEGDSYNGVAPLGQTSYGENEAARNARYERIADAIALMLLKQQPDFFTLQEIRAYLPGVDGMLTILPDGLWAAIAKRLEGSSYAAAEYKGSIIDTAGNTTGNITLYNRSKFVSEIIPQEGQQLIASLPQQQNLGAHALDFIPRNAEQTTTKVRICNVHADYNDQPMGHEKQVREFLVAGDAEDTSVVVGDFNCMFAPLHTEPRIIATSAVPNFFRDGTMQGACAIDGAFYKSKTDPICQAESIHIDVNTGQAYTEEQLRPVPLEHLPDNQQAEETRFRMVMSAGKPFEAQENKLNSLIGINSKAVSIYPAVNLRNESAIAIMFSNENVAYFDSIGLPSTLIVNQQVGSTKRVAFLPAATAGVTLHNVVIPAILKDRFMAAYSERLQQDRSLFCGFFANMRRSRINENMSLPDILRHALSDNNRSRGVFVQLGWLDRQGQAIGSTPDAIREMLVNIQQPAHQVSHP